MRQPVIVLFTIRSDNYERLQLAKELEGLRQQTLQPASDAQGFLCRGDQGAGTAAGRNTPRAQESTTRWWMRCLLTLRPARKDALPLLAFTLERLYSEYGGTGNLKLEHYEKLGRIEGSSRLLWSGRSKAADADDKVPKDKQVRQTLLRRGLIPWLAGIDPDTGAPRRYVARLSEIPAESATTHRSSHRAATAVD